MAEQERKVKISFDSNADQAAKDSNNLAKSLIKVEESTLQLEKANQALLDTEGKTEAQIRALELSQRKATAAQKDAVIAHGEQSKAAKNTTQSLEQMGGGIGGVISSMKAMLKQMALLIANPLVLAIVLIAGSLALLFKAFTSTKEGGEALDRVMSGIGAVVDVLRDRFLSLAGALGKLFTGDFIGAATDAKNAISGFGDEVEKEFKQASDAKRFLQEANDAMRDLGVTRARLNRDLAASKEIITDENASYADKKKAIDAVRIAEGKQTDAELANAQKRLNAIKTANSLSDTSAEDLQKQADAETALFRLQEEQSTNKRAFNRLDRRADSEETSRIKAINDARQAVQKEQIAKNKEANKLIIEEQKRHNDELNKIATAQRQAETDRLNKIALDNEKAFDEALKVQADAAKATANALLSENELKVQAENEAYAIKLEALKLANLGTEEVEIEHKRVLAELNDQFFASEADKAKVAADKQIEVESFLEDTKKTIRQKANENISAGISLIANLFSRNKAIQKGALIADGAVGIAKSIVNTNASNIAATASGAALAIPTAGASVAAAAALVTQNTISAGIGIAGIIAATSKGLSALGGGGNVSGSSVVGAGGGGRSAAPPPVAFNNTAENQIGQSLVRAQADQPPILVSVNVADINKAQKEVLVLVNKNSF
jgi:hypothetical protein